MKTTILPLRNSMNRSPLRAFLLIAFVLACFALSLQAQTCQEGCLANENTALGDDALISITTGYHNTGIGFDALSSNTTGRENTAVGWGALSNNTTGSGNVALGAYALHDSNSGANTALGYRTLVATVAGLNTAVGSEALSLNTTGYWNVGVGASALYGNLTGIGNVAAGQEALSQLTDGSYNIAIGLKAGEFITGSNNIAIGNNGVSGESGAIRIGTEGTHTATYIAGINAAPLTSGTAVAVGITADGQLGVRASSARFKEAIKPMDKASEAILDLKPVIFRYKKQLDPKSVPQFGLVAEEVAKVDPDLVVTDKQSKPFTVRYDEVNTMLLNEFLKEHQKVQELQATVARQEEQIETLTSGLQKMSAQIEVTASARQTIGQ
jgi:hypothetical protein